MRLSVVFSIILIGFTAIVSQIVFTRELLIVFCGNELSIAFILAGWLIGGFLGSYTAGSISDRLRNRVSIFGICQIALAILLPMTIVVIRSLRIIINVTPGEIVPIFPVAIASLIALLPVCATLGFMFSLGARIHEPELKLGAIRIGEVYMLEAVGAILGGVTASFILIRFLSPVQIMGLLGFVTIVASLSLIRSFPGEKLSKPMSFIALLLLAVIAGLWLSGGWNVIERYSLDRGWRGSQLIASKNSIYGNVAIIKKDLQFSIFDNGLRLYTVPDKPTAEEAVHFALLEHPDPKKVLLIGGGAGGLVGEISKHPVERIDYVELDPLIITMSKKYITGGSRNELAGPKVNIIYEDGRRYIRTSKEKYDVVIINIGDPYTAQMNRFYTFEFYRLTRSIMNKGGVLSFGLGASESYVGDELANFLRSIFATLAEAFPDVKVIPGETAYFLASNKEGLLTYNYNVLMNRAKDRNIDLRYVREYYLTSRMSPELIAYTENIVKGGIDIRVNRDFNPAAYYYGVTAWAARFKDSLLSKVLKNVSEKKIGLFAISVFGAILISGFMCTAKARTIKAAATLSVLVNGYSQMSFQIIILLAFQMIYGFMYYKLGIILTAFMVGIAIGSVLAIKVFGRWDAFRRRFVLIILEVCLCSYPFLLFGALNFLSGPHGEFINWLGPNVIFIILPVLSGGLGGFIFPVASGLCLSGEDQRGKTAGANYGKYSSRAPAVSMASPIP